MPGKVYALAGSKSIDATESEARSNRDDDFAKMGARKLIAERLAQFLEPIAPDDHRSDTMFFEEAEEIAQLRDAADGHATDHDMAHDDVAKWQ